MCANTRRQVDILEYFLVAQLGASIAAGQGFTISREPGERSGTMSHSRRLDKTSGQVRRVLNDPVALVKMNDRGPLPVPAGLPRKPLIRLSMRIGLSMAISLENENEGTQVHRHIKPLKEFLVVQLLHKAGVDKLFRF